VYAATSSSERVAFRQISEKTGNRLRQQLIDDVTREPIEAGEKARLSKSVSMDHVEEPLRRYAT
jgi:non-homologous end joining protein Ku